MRVPLALALLLVPAVAVGATPPPTPECEVVQIETSDGLKLEADWCPAAANRVPAVILLHMIPPHHDRSNYPEKVRQAWQDQGFAVLNLDRRGAGRSEGKAADAYKGSSGKLDVEAAVRFLRTRGEEVDPDTFACVGASNGTTSCLDYTVHAAATEGAPMPRALVMMTGGRYTEAQNTLLGSPAEKLPVLFTYNAAEKAWSEAQRQGEHPTWSWKQYSPGGHGTQVFGPNPEAAADISEFLLRHLLPEPR